jgi:hypothetical protein
MSSRTNIEEKIEYQTNIEKEKREKRLFGDWKFCKVIEILDVLHPKAHFDFDFSLEKHNSGFSVFKPIQKKRV